MAQYRTDRNPHDLIFASAHPGALRGRPAPGGDDDAAGRAGHGVPAVRPGQRRAGQPGHGGQPADAGGYQTAYLWEQVWQRDAWLDLLGSFVHVEDGRVLFPRFHQWHAVRSIIDATTATVPGWTGWSSTRPGRGSRTPSPGPRTPCRGCTARTTQPIFDKVVVITDRKVLDRQLQDTVAGLEHTPGTIVRIDENSAAAQGGAGGQRGPGHHHDAAEVPRRRRARRQGRRRGRGQGCRRAPVRGHRRRGALLHQRRLGREAEEGPRTGDATTLRRGRGGRGRGERRRSEPDAAAAGQRAAPGQAEEPVVLRVHRDPEAEDARDVRAARRRTGTSGRSTPTRCARPSRRASSSTCWRTTRPTACTTSSPTPHPRNDPEWSRARAGRRWPGSPRCTRTSWRPRPRSSSSTSGRRPPARSTATPRRWWSPAPGCTRCGRSRPSTRTSPKKGYDTGRAAAADAGRVLRDRGRPGRARGAAV